MAKTIRNLLIFVVMAIRTGDAAGQGMSSPDPIRSQSRVRFTKSEIEDVANEGAARSPTFRRLLKQIERTDGLIYVSEGACIPQIRACLLMQLDQAGPNRMLRIHIAPGSRDDQAIVSIGHELQHAIEVLSDARVRTTEDMFVLFQRIGADPPSSSLQSRTRFRFETIAAVAAGNTIRDELSHAHQEKR